MEICIYERFLSDFATEYLYIYTYNKHFNNRLKSIKNWISLREYLAHFITLYITIIN